MNGLEEKTVEYLKSICELWLDKNEYGKVTAFFFITSDIMNNQIESTYEHKSLDNAIVDDFIRSLVQIKLKKDTESIKKYIEIINDVSQHITSRIVKENDKLKKHNEFLKKIIITENVLN
jgi:hypothetical protein